MRLRDLLRRNVDDAGERRPVMPVWIGILHASFLVILQRNARKAGAEACHPLKVPLLRHEGSAVLLSPPAETSLPFQDSFVAVDTEEDWTDDVEFGEEDVDERNALPTEIVQCEDVTCDGTEIVGYKRLDAGFVDELRDHSFCEDVEEIKE